METKEMYKENAIKLIEILEKNGYEGYFVGGCVRDMVMGRKYHDIDIATSAKPEKTKEIFENEGYGVYETGIKHGTVSVVCNGDVYEITTYRIDGSYTDSRHPDCVEFTEDITLDLSRRDFTVNAMAMDREGNIVDPFGGKEDIENGIIRCVGDARERFNEDALRILRAMRFAATLEFEIDDEAMMAMKLCGHLIPNVAGERIFSELCKMISGERAGEVIYRCADIIDWTLFPHPFTRNLLTYEIWDIMGALSSFRDDVVLRISAIICMCGTNQKGSVAIGQRFIDRMKTDKKTAMAIKYITSAVFEKLPVGRAKIHREMAKWGEENFLDVLEIKEMLVMIDVLSFDSYLMEAFDICSDIIDGGGCMPLSALAVNGNDLFDIGIEKSPRTGEILNHLLNEVVEGRVNNQKDELLMFVCRHFADKM